MRATLGMGVLLVVAACTSSSPTSNPTVAPLPSTCARPSGGGCGGVDVPTSSPTVTATPTVAPTTSPTPTPLNTVGCSAVSSGALLAVRAMFCTGPMVLSLPEPGTPLDPGLYSNRDFQPTIWFQ